MIKQIKSRKRISMILAAICCMALLVSSFAFFTDRLTADAHATAGNIDLVWEDTSLKTGSNNEFAQDDAWVNKALVTAGNIINPGDHFDLSYELTNAGSKSIDVRQRIVLHSSVAMTKNAYEYALTITGGKDDTKVVPTVSEDMMTLTYDLKDIVIDGSKETEDGVVSGAYTVTLDFAKAAKNAFMDSTVDVNLYAAAKQHRNTEETDFPAFTAMASIMQNTGWENK